MTWPSFLRSPRRWIGGVTVGAIASVLALAWLGSRAIAEWQRSAELIAERSAASAADLLYTAVTRDMRGVQENVLSSLWLDDEASDGALDISAVASAFARYPYPELFFAAKRRPARAPIAFYSRATRPPAWLPQAVPASSRLVAFPVVVAFQPGFGPRLLDRINRDIRDRRALSAFDMTIEGVHYQVVAVPAYADSAKSTIDGVLGFMVNLDWVRLNYFGDLTSEIGRIRSIDPGMQLAVADEHGTVRAGVASGGQGPSSVRAFPLFFFKPSTIALDPAPDLERRWWSASATMTGDHELMAARTGARVTLLMAAISALVLAGGLGLSARALLARVRLSDMRSDFVAAVTHELKTPAATIRAIGESLVRRTSVDDGTRRDYGGIVVDEARRLTRLIDNLLAYARISDTTDAYTFKPISIAPVVTRSMNEFRFRLDADGFDVRVDVPESLPPVRGDALALSLAVGNLLDNAIRYSDDRRRLAVRAAVVEDSVSLEVTDAGVGIPPHELARVTQKFFRGSGAASGGSGLGLSIAERIVSDHSGRLSVRSEVGVGTTVTVMIPIAEPIDDTSVDC